MAKNNISPNSELALGDDQYRAYIERSSEGFCLVFTDEAVFQGKGDQAIGVGELFYTWIFFHAEGKDGYSEYKGELPGGISFSDTREDVLKKMGTPSWQRMSKDGQRIITDRWELPNYRLHVTYSKKTGNCIRRYT